MKSKLEKFADNVTTKLADLAQELNSIKENRLNSIVVLENVVEELKKEKVDLCKANDELRKHNTSMTYTITELSLSNKNLENEKSSLLTALQLSGRLMLGSCLALPTLDLISPHELARD